jgi:patatin-like phospholipase/acyl hydrolase
MVGAMNVSELETIKQSGYAANGTRYYIITGDIHAADPTGKAWEWLKTNTKVVKQSGAVIIARGV